MKGQKRNWYDYLWIASVLYLVLGFFNILFAWIGMLCFITPLLISSVKGDKTYCNKFCGKAQLLNILGHKFRLSAHRPTPRFLKSKWFRYAFLLFFLTMFVLMIVNTLAIFEGQSLKQAVTLLWSFRLPWHFAYHGTLFSPWTAQFAFGFYGVMLTSTILGIVALLLFKPRTWCVVCPMGTMTQLICQVKN